MTSQSPERQAHISEAPPDPATPPPHHPGQVRATDARRAMLAYLTVPIFMFVPALAVYLSSLRRSRWTRGHAAQAVNVSLTALLYDASGIILGLVLALDTPRTAILVMLPIAAALWLVTLVFLLRAAAAAGRGEEYRFPRWLCSQLVR